MRNSKTTIRNDELASNNKKNLLEFPRNEMFDVKIVICSMKRTESKANKVVFLNIIWIHMCYEYILVLCFLIFTIETSAK